MYLDVSNVQPDFLVRKEQTNVASVQKECTRMNQEWGHANLVQKERSRVKAVASLKESACLFVDMGHIVPQDLFLAWNAKETLLAEPLQSMDSKNASTALQIIIHSNPVHRTSLNVERCAHRERTLILD